MIGPKQRSNHPPGVVASRGLPTGRCPIPAGGHVERDSFRSDIGGQQGDRARRAVRVDEHRNMLLDRSRQDEATVVVDVVAEQLQASRRGHQLGRVPVAAKDGGAGGPGARFR